MVELKIMEYNDGLKEKWDSFVLKSAVNGTFLQTKNFLDYHGERFIDSSLIMYKGTDTIVAVVPACTIVEGDKKIFNAHCGSTFGGIVIAESFYNIEHVDSVMTALEDYLFKQDYNEIIFKCTSDIFARRSSNLLYYFLFQRGYTPYDEISFYIDFEDYNADIASNFSSSRRRGYKYSLKNELYFRELKEDKEIEDFYNILCDNLKKHNTKPVHTLNELLEFKNKRLTEVVKFYGVFCKDKMISGSMMFLFDKKVFHAQYFAADQNCLNLYPMNFLDANLIAAAREMGFRYFSFGTSTLEHGKVLNKPLAEFKEGFGAQYSINKTYVKSI